VEGRKSRNGERCKKESVSGIGTSKEGRYKEENSNHKKW
jgi:hypothetical protein